MKTNALSPKIYRVIDANINRLKEAIRVLEDIARYYDDNKIISLQLKELRHKIKIDNSDALLNARDSVRDVLKQSTNSEMKRDNIKDVIIANFKRTQESSRVLEEMNKLINTQTSANFKEIRYALYQVEKTWYI